MKMTTLSEKLTKAKSEKSEDRHNFLCLKVSSYLNLRPFLMHPEYQSEPASVYEQAPPYYDRSMRTLK